MNDTSIKLLIKALTMPIIEILWQCSPNLNQSSLCLLDCGLTGTSKRIGSYRIFEIAPESLNLVKIPGSCRPLKSNDSFGVA